MAFDTLIGKQTQQAECAAARELSGVDAVSGGWNIVPGKQRQGNIGDFHSGLRAVDDDEERCYWVRMRLPGEHQHARWFRQPPVALHGAAANRNVASLTPTLNGWALEPMPIPQHGGRFGDGLQFLLCYGGGGHRVVGEACEAA